jgi:phosphonate transport system substrate-binding protein
MAEPWLDTQLAKEGAKPTAAWLGKITKTTKLSHVVLPVFFHQCDACVAMRSEFETLCELNPQLGQQLQIIARSPEMVTAMFCFRADYAPAFKAKIFAGLEDLNKTPAGQQVLTIFESEKTAVEPASCLDSALEILALRAQLADRAEATDSANSQPQAGAPQTLGGANP